MSASYDINRSTIELTTCEENTNKRWFKLQSSREKGCLIAILVFVALSIIFIITTIILLMEKNENLSAISTSTTNSLHSTSQYSIPENLSTISTFTTNSLNSTSQYSIPENLSESPIPTTSNVHLTSQNIISDNLTEAPNSTVNKVCLTSQCVMSAAMLLNSMNFNVDPCEDFYSYACGNWAKGNQTENRNKNQFSVLSDNIYEELKELFFKTVNDFPKLKNSSKIIKYAVNLYRSCLNSGNITQTYILKNINEIGGFPFPNKMPTEYVNIYEIIAKAKTLLNVDSLFQFHLVPFNNVSVNIITIFPPNPRAYNLTAFLKILLKNNFSKIKNEYLQIKKLEQIIEDAKNYSSGFEILTIGKLTNLTKSNHWLTIIRLIMKNNWNQFNITEKEPILVHDINYFVNLFKNIRRANIPKRTIVNYIRICAALSFFEILPNLEYEIRKDEICFQFVNKNMRFVNEHIYFINTNTSKTNAVEMIEYLKIAFRQLAKEATWLDDRSRQAVFDKLAAIIPLTGYNPVVANITLLEKYYEHLDEITDRDLILNSRKLIKFNVTKELSSLREHNNRSSWSIDFIFSFAGTEVNAIYNRLTNSIILPAAIQQFPFFDLNRPWYQNFGGIGAVIGHEITHGFDNEGSQRDKYGNLTDLWNPDIKIKFQEKTKCFIKQYDNYKLSEINQTINGTKTLAENIADNGGLRQAYKAYRNWEEKFGKEKLLPELKFDSYQLFFLSFANIYCSSYSPDKMKLINKNNVHTISKYRVIGTLSNMKEFSEAFNCKKGSAMNPENKCIIW